MEGESIKDLEINEIAIFRALHLGDLITIIPSVRALRKSFPQAKITLIGLPWAEQFVKRFSRYFDRFIEFPGFPGLPERTFSPKAFTSFLSKVQRENFDLVIQMQGSGSITNRIIALFGAKNIAGFYCNDSYRPQGDFFIKYAESGHEVERFIKLIEGLGIKNDGTDLEFPVFEAEAEEVKKLLTKHDLQEREYVCVHTGSREKARKWKPHNFAQVAKFIHSKGYRVVFTGTKEERENISNIIQIADIPSINLAGSTHLGELAEVLKKAVMLVSNDTGAVHVAAAVGAQSVVIYTKGNSNLKRWAPLNRNKHSIIKPRQARQVDHVIMEINSRLRAIAKTVNGDDDYARAI